MVQEKKSVLLSPAYFFNRKLYTGKRGTACTCIHTFCNRLICTVKVLKSENVALKLKGGLGVKNFVVGLTWGAFIAGLAGSNCGNMIPMVLVFTFFGVKLFVNSTIYDFKDVKGDTLAGIKTLPVSLGERNTRKLPY